MTITTRTTLTLLLALLLLAGGCSSWGGKINNTEGVNYYAKGQYDQALTAFQTASRLNPDDPEIYYNIASTYQQQALRYQDPSLLTQAETNYRVCLQKNPTRETTVCCYRGLATVLNQRKDDKQALKVLQDWEAKEPNAVEPKLEIAYLLEAQGRNREAADALTKIKDWAPNDYRAFYKLGLVEEKLGNDAEALEQLRAAARLNPANQDITAKITQLERKQSSPMVGPSAETAQNSDAQSAVSVAPAFVSKTASSVQNEPAAAASPAQDGFTPVGESAPPPLGADPLPGSAPADSGVPGTAPSYDSPAPGALPATAPEADPGSTSAPSGGDIDSLLDSELTKTQNPAPVWTAASPVQPAGAANPAPATVGGVALPDGTGSAPFKLAYTGTPSASASSTAAPAGSAVRKSSVGDPNPGPPRTSVGVPF